MTDTALQSLTDWLVTTIASIEEMDRTTEEEPMKVTIDPADTVLSPALAEVHAYLVDNGGSVTPAGLAVVFGIKAPAMDQRLRQLQKKGLAENVSRGLWRAVK